MAKKKLKNVKRKKLRDPWFTQPPRWYYYKDGALPPGDWTVTGTDIDRWYNMMRSRFPDYQFVVKFREKIDQDGNLIPGTREMAFWFESVPETPPASEHVEEEEEIFEEVPEEKYSPDFIRFCNPRNYWVNNEEGLPWYPVQAFVDSSKPPEAPDRDRTKEWTQVDEFDEVYNYYEISPLLQFLQSVPNQELAMS